MDNIEGQGRGRGVGRGRGLAHGRSASAASIEIGQGRGHDRGRGLNPPNAAPAPQPAVTRNPPLLSQQEGHKSALVLSGRSVEPMVVRKHKITIKWDGRFRDYLVKAGFYGLHKIGYVRSDRYLISALVERWRPETHSFHLPVGEMMVTLQDAGVLLGLPIDGEAICKPVDERQDWPGMIKAYLGRDVDEHTFCKNSKTNIRISWLNSEFNKSLSTLADDHEVECYVRAYILMLLGSLLFTDLSGDAISVKYLPFLRDLNKTAKYSWGSAVLAYLNKELCRVCRESAMQMGGPILLLQIWAWERFLFGRPTVRHGVPEPRLGGPVAKHRPPYGYLWSGYHDWTENPARVLDYYRDELDYLREYQVNWEPYNESKLALLPSICTSARDLWMYVGPVVHFQIVEPHNPKRVMRQFGKHQEVPPNPSRTFNNSPCSNKEKHTRINRESNHAEYVKKWTRRWRSLFVENRDFDPSTYGEYMRWYSENTILYLQPARAIGPLPGNPRDLLYQIRAGNTHKAAEKIKAMRKEAVKQTTEAVDEATRAFARLMLTGFMDLLEILGEYDNSRVQRRQQQLQGTEAVQQQDVGNSSHGADHSRGKRLRGG